MEKKEVIRDLPTILTRSLFVYDLLRYFLGNPPDKQVLLHLCREENMQSLAHHREGASFIYSFLQDVKKGMADDVWQDTISDYNRLFIGPNSLPVPLWESVYLGPEHLMFGEETIRVRACYEKFGIEFIRRAHEPEDHIAIELEFLCFLIRRTLAVFEANDMAEVERYLEGRIAFLKDHLLQWAPEFANNLINSTSNKLYRGIGKLLLEHLFFDVELATGLREAISHE